jgi:two-component system, OmpR family, alkaline phosphatase synthesis response regulator PhoP
MGKIKPRILCVDDNEDTCVMLSFVLALSSYEVESAFTFAEGLNKALAGGYQFIILDSQLPDGCGSDLCNQIRQKDRQTPICFYSADAYPGQIEAAMDAGANAYLIKPIDPFEVEKTITRLLQ